MNRRKQTIKFSGPAGRLGYLSNSYQAVFYEEGISWPSVEHYFQAHKFPNIPYYDIIRTAPTPEKAKEYGRSSKYKILSNWDKIREDIMRNAMRLKFSQNLILREALKDTKNNHIEYDSDEDFWGNGTKGNGQNLMGECLMAIREELKNL